MSKEKTISVKHFLNERLKYIEIDNKKAYPLYVGVGFNRKYTEFRSSIDKYIFIDDINKIDTTSIILKEKKLIIDIIRRNEKNKNFNIKSFQKNIDFYDKELNVFLTEILLDEIISLNYKNKLIKDKDKIDFFKIAEFYLFYYNESEQKELYKKYRISLLEFVNTVDKYIGVNLFEQLNKKENGLSKYGCDFSSMITFYKKTITKNNVKIIEVLNNESILKSISNTTHKSILNMLLLEEEKITSNKEDKFFNEVFNKEFKIKIETSINKEKILSL